MSTSAQPTKIKVGIVGATGYTGVELLRLLAQHPHAEITAVTSRQESGMPVADMFPSLRGHVDAVFKTPDEAALDQCDVVFFATPHGVAMKEAQQLVDKGVKIIDLAADFRLQDTALFEKWYKMPHACPDILKESVYGLVEIHREKIAQARVVGNPGCYPVTVLLGTAPLWSPEKALVEARVVADCKSGVSGAGRKAAVGSLFSEASDNFKAYGVAGHRHHPEISAQLKALNGGKDVHLTFVPHLVPMIRGMFSTLYLRILPEAMGTDFQALYEQFYANEYFVDVMPAGAVPETRSVRASNKIRIALQRHDDQLIVMVAQDNLVKGASGQAVQNMNLMFNLPEQTGLEHVAILP
ncbi:N-acetyl-gamma-glutamyl-phosphate reductase [Paenalcaligenes hermetiae]|uniref:N-acetyl-gamma-glutamyl-phosphate reductase n=1 Tax=Paenalcaligenes hermetiae TaxID=1157987 RepID=A0ABP9LSL2_9BURK